MQGRGQGKVFCSHSCANQLQDSITNSANRYTCVQATYWQCHWLLLPSSLSTPLPLPWCSHSAFHAHSIRHIAMPEECWKGKAKAASWQTTKEQLQGQQQQQLKQLLCLSCSCIWLSAGHTPHCNSICVCQYVGVSVCVCVGVCLVLRKEHVNFLIWANDPCNLLPA